MDFKAKIGAFFFTSFVFLFFPLATFAFVPAPIVIAPENESLTGSARPLIKGVASASAFVEVSIDGGRFVKAQLGKTKTRTNSFAFRPKQALNPGDHKIEIRARHKKTQELSDKLLLSVTVIPFSAPTLLKTESVNWPGNPRPLILGLAKNGSKIRLIIDGRADAERRVSDNSSGTANFALIPLRDLAAGLHTARAVAIDKNGKRSFSSNELVFGIGHAFVPPTLFPPLLSEPGAPKRPLITGVARSGSLVNIYLNWKLEASFRAGVSKTGVAGFKWQPKEDIEDGKYVIVSRAISRTGDKSRFSNQVFVNVGAAIESELPKQPPKKSKEEEVKGVAPSAVATTVLPTLPEGGSRTALVIGLIILGLLVFAFLIWLFRTKPPEGPDGENQSLPLPPSPPNI